MADDRLRGRADDVRLLELLPAGNGHLDRRLGPAGEPVRRQRINLAAADIEQRRGDAVEKHLHSRELGGNPAIRVKHGASARGRPREVAV